VPNAGLLPAAALAQRIDLCGLVDSRLRLATHGANSGAKALSVIGSVFVAGDSIDDVVRAARPVLPSRRSTARGRRRRSGRGFGRTSGPAGRASGPTDPCFAADVVHRLGLPRLRHRPRTSTGRTRGRPHRRHAVVEQTIAELKSAGLTHVPSVHGQRRLARARRHGAQPRPRRRSTRRRRPKMGDRRNAAPQGLHDARRLVSSGRRRHYACRPAGPGPTRSTPHWPRSTPSRCAADQGSQPDDQALGQSRQTGRIRTPSSRAIARRRDQPLISHHPHDQR